MNETFMVQEGIWNPRDNVYVWHDAVEFDYLTPARAFAEISTATAVRVVRCRVVYERVPAVPE